MQGTTKPSLTPVLVNVLYVLLAIPLAMLLKGCSASSTPLISDLPQLRAKPPLSTDLPSARYSDSVRTNIERWESELMATQVMSQPATQPGQPSGPSRPPAK